MAYYQGTSPLVTIEVKGMQELVYALKAFPLEFKEKVARQATRAGSVVIKNYAVSLAPTRARDWEGWGKKQHPPGNLKRNIKEYRINP